MSIKEANVKMKNRRPRPRPPVKTSYNGTSGSEEVKHHPDRHHRHHYQIWESSMESIESSSAFTLKVKKTRKITRIKFNLTDIIMLQTWI